MLKKEQLNRGKINSSLKSTKHPLKCFLFSDSLNRKVDLYTKTKIKRNELLIIITHPQILQQAKSQIEYWKRM